MKRCLFPLLTWTLVLLCTTNAISQQLYDPVLRFVFVYDNYAFNEDLKTDWGFACLIQGTEKTILFDTGRNGELLLENFEKMGLDPLSPKVVVVSHNHRDHTGGLTEFLKKNNDVSIYVPASFPDKFVDEVEAAGAKVIRVTKPVKICKNVFLTGEMGEAIKEQGLILDRDGGLVLITGCAHPGIVAMTQRAKEYKRKDVVMALGGFHLNKLSTGEAKAVAVRLKELGVRQIGPTHCTGDKAIDAFNEVFDLNFLRLGVGRTLVMEYGTGGRQDPVSTVRAEDIGRTVTVLGRLGKPLREMMTVRGIWEELTGPQDKPDERLRFRVTHVNGSTLQRCVNLHRYDLEVVKKDREEVEPAKGEVWKFRAYGNVAGPWPPSRLLE